MDPGETARAVVDDLIAQGVRDVNNTDERLRSIIAAALQAAVAGERGRCANVINHEREHVDALRASPIGTPPGVDIDAGMALFQLHRDLFTGEPERIVLLFAEYRCVARIEGRHEVLTRIAAAIRREGA